MQNFFFYYIVSIIYMEKEKRMFQDSSGTKKGNPVANSLNQVKSFVMYIHKV